MGLFKKMGQLTGSVNKKLLTEGLLGRGLITDVEQTSVSRGQDAYSAPVCIFTVQVTLDDVPAYEASCRQAVPLALVPQLASGGAQVAVRVNPNDHSEIALDLATEAPTVRMAEGDGAAKASDILATGLDARAVIVESMPLGKTNPAGLDMYAFSLTVMRDGEAPYQTQVGNPVPKNAIPLIYPGHNLPAKVMASNPKGVVIDWERSVQEATQHGGEAPVAG